MRVLAVLLVLALAACTPAPATTPRPTPGPGTLCDTDLYSQTVEGGVELTATPLDELGLPYQQLIDAGIRVTCTAHFATADGPEFDAALVDLPIADLEDDLDALLVGWTRDPDAAATWRDDAEPGHRIQAIEIEEGVLVTRTFD